MARYKNIELDDSLVGMIRNMDTVEEYREVLQSLQTVWDNLTLLGQMSGSGTDMSGTRQAFNQLTSDLLNQLGTETLKKCVQEMNAKSQVAIDILVRNLFERTADIGFLATDEDIRRYIGFYAAQAREANACGDESAAAALARERESLRARFAEYVAKYSVYSDIILLDTAGCVLARFDDSVEVRQTRHPLLHTSLTTDDAYVESFGAIDLLPNCAKALVYSYRVTDGESPIGVLCLCFRFENEMERIFANLSADDDWPVILLLDTNGQVVASSDAFHIPVGATLERALDEDYRVIRFAGREYLATTRATQGYQGYMGPGWFGQVMLPVQHAFNEDASQVLRDVKPEVLRAVMENSSFFGEALRSIPIQANRIQSDLNRSVWNGNVRQSSSSQTFNRSFSKILLWEISNTGARTKDVFARSIANLHETVVSTILQDSCFLASLAIDIMDRNLYERANDCRWWALTSTFREILDKSTLEPADRERMTAILRTINGLYTVYANLIVFDVRGHVLAVSQDDQAGLVGKRIDEDWVRQVLTLPDSQGYAVSRFAATPFYAGRHTYIYGAAIHAVSDERVIGGVGIVFDSEPQFAAMLRDALPRDARGEPSAGCFGAFVDTSGHLVASTDPQRHPGERLAIDAAFYTQAAGRSHVGIVRLGDSYYAAGARMSAGYREYKNDDGAYRNEISALIFIPLCQVVEQGATTGIPRLHVRSDRTADGETVEIASFLVGNRWFGLRSAQIAEAVDYADAAGIPGAGQDFIGYRMYCGSPIPIFDIRSIVGGGPAIAGTRPQIVILKKGPDSHFGILVDALGDIPEVLSSRMQDLPSLLGGGNVLADTIVMTDKPESETLLVVLSVERIAARLVAPVPDAGLIPSDGEILSLLENAGTRTPVT
ncbi:chemotaxis protein CheW [Paludibacterium yongneupense]|uniref:chemotaxis protein CheW n=1 Tax=Paludibacterium yongneupense TaxID=400061 RepID=UPI0003FEBBDC|nr:chemotaxis protein CheW [Paludibacterium yongneupense]